MFYTLLIVSCTISVGLCAASDITNIVFGHGDASKGIIGAFGDFNSDELTDVFVIKNKSRTLEILLGSDVEPLLKQSRNLRCDFKTLEITSVVPGDFDGDAFMDLLITTKSSKGVEHILDVYINWGGSEYLNCTNETKPIMQIYGEPVALDYNKDMIIDLFGFEHNETDRTFWIFNKDRKPPNVIKMHIPNRIKNDSKLRIPHSHAYLDLNNDFTADLFLTGEEHFEIWHGLEHEGFEFSQIIKPPIGTNSIFGQTLFMDVDLNGNISQVMPICFDQKCHNSAILVHAGNEFHNLNINFVDGNNVQWGFIVPEHQSIYLNAITMRAGDFNMDGYPDLLVTLRKTTGGQPQTFYMENVKCDGHLCGSITRKFQISWTALAPFSNGTITGAFYDFYQDGILDVLMVERDSIGGDYRQVAFRNTLDYDANFVKVIVLTGLTNSHEPTRSTPLGRKKRTYGTNLPGPRIAYYTTTQEGSIRHGSSVQIPQSAYFSLHLPYTIFGLGRTPNFVDSLTVGLSNRSREWKQLIPNSQMIVVPWPPEEPARWKAQLFVTPSKLIWMSVIALGSTCLIILFIILGLYVKEKREDKLERQLAAHRFHFDAM